jgi:nitroreductase
MKYNLSEISSVIRDRRTIYPEQFSDRKVHKEIIENILNNAIWAPTHGMTQPWRFKVFMGSGIEKLGAFQAKHYKEKNIGDQFDKEKHEKFLNRPRLAQAVIAICMERQLTEKIPEIEEVEAVACAVQNMYLTCTAYGLGAYWGSGGATYSDEMKEFLKLNPKDLCLGFFYIGYPSVEWPKSHRKPIEYVTEWIEQ